MFLNDIIFSTNLCSSGVLLKFDNLFSSGSGANISPTEMYLVEFSNELSIPSGNTVTVSPSGYSIKNAKSFTPECFVKIKSQYTEGSQTLIKLTVKDINYDVLKTQYKRIICSPKPEKQCLNEEDPQQNYQYIILNQRNNWEYRHNGHLIAKFVPILITDDISIKLRKKNINQLPLPNTYQPIPTVSLVHLLDSGTMIITDLGELIFNPNAYQNNDEIIVNYDSDMIIGSIDSPLLLLTN